MSVNSPVTHSAAEQGGERVDSPVEEKKRCVSVMQTGIISVSPIPGQNI